MLTVAVGYSDTGLEWSRRLVKFATLSWIFRNSLFYLNEQFHALKQWKFSFGDKSRKRISWGVERILKNINLISDIHFSIAQRNRVSPMCFIRPQKRFWKYPPSQYILIQSEKLLVMRREIFTSIELVGSRNTCYRIFYWIREEKVIESLVLILNWIEEKEFSFSGHRWKNTHGINYRCFCYSNNRSIVKATSFFSSLRVKAEWN